MSSGAMSEPWHLLVVDDEPANCDIIAEYLADQPFVLDFAGDGAAALRRLAAPGSRCDVVILDRMMPGIDGIEVLRRLKAEPRWALTPVIIQTAAVSPEQVREGLAAGAYYYLTKPYLPGALVGIVWAAIDGLHRACELDARAKRAAAGASASNAAAMAGCDYSFATLEEADRLAALLGAQCPDPEAAAMGLAELLLNAVEHGNLAIAYQEKARLKREGSWRQEVDRRLRMAQYRDRRATVRMDRSGGRILFTITDQGSGFDWRKFADFDPARAFDPNGRGIALARKLSFNSVDYAGSGNKVVATVLTEPPRPSATIDRSRHPTR
jgi:CheY-like chemotaxis protein